MAEIQQPTTFLAFCTIIIPCVAQALQWQERSSYTSIPNLGRHHPIVFANETHGFLLGGTTVLNDAANDFYIYDEANDTWTNISSSLDPKFPARSFGYGVVLNEVNHPKAYLGFGLGTRERLNDFWEFDMMTFKWKQLASCPGPGRRHPSMVPVYTNDGKWLIHVGLGDGYVESFSNFKDYWSYDIANNQWTQLPDFPSVQRHHPFFFGIGDTSYTGLGHSDGLNIERDFFSYSAATGEWTKEPTFESYVGVNEPVVVTKEARVAGTEFSIELPPVGASETENSLRGSIGFVLSGDGDDHGTMAEGEFHAFYPSPVDGFTWRQLPSHPGASRWAPGSFVMRGTARAYFTSGYDRSTKMLHSDVWMIDLSSLFLPDSSENSTAVITSNNTESNATTPYPTTAPPFTTSGCKNHQSAKTLILATALSVLLCMIEK